MSKKKKKTKKRKTVSTKVDSSAVTDSTLRKTRESLAILESQLKATKAARDSIRAANSRKALLLKQQKDMLEKDKSLLAKPRKKPKKRKRPKGR